MLLSAFRVINTLPTTRRIQPWKTSTTWTSIKSKKVRRRRVFVYIMHEERQIEIPGNGYMRVCLEGYKDFGFDIAPLLEAYDHSLEVAQ